MWRQNMISLELVDTEDFMSMSMEAKCLYFEMAVRADEQGVFKKLKTLLRNSNLDEYALEELEEHDYVVVTDNGWVVLLLETTATP